MKHHNILRNTNVNNHLNETNVAISLHMSITNHLKLVRIYLPNPVYSVCTDYVNVINRGKTLTSTDLFYHDGKVKTFKLDAATALQVSMNQNDGPDCSALTPLFRAPVCTGMCELSDTFYE